MARKSIFERILHYNRGRDPERLAIKLHVMQANAFRFLRGTCHLFYEDLPRNPILRKAPITWICGDLHLENFGSYKGDNRLAYFDMNDFDEASLAPCTWELLRFLVSVLIGAKTLKGSQPIDAPALCRGFLDAYGSALQDGKAQWIERETATGLVKELLDELRDRQRKVLLSKYTRIKNGGRQIKIDGKKTLAIEATARQKVKVFMKQFTAAQSNPRFFRMLDVARRVAGTGSLGVDRTIILVEGKGSPNGNYLLDLKEALPSCLTPKLRVRQPVWNTEAERIVAIQQRMQAVSPAFLHAVVIDKKSYVLRGLQSSQDRVDLQRWDGREGPLEQVMTTLGQLAAWGQLRSSGRQGSASADELVAFGAKTKWRKALIEVALEYSKKVEQDWESYCVAAQRKVSNR
ncbi:MAG: DUF2252 domain-containing protein [Gammaproteobacteria bacterium]